MDRLDKVFVYGSLKSGGAVRGLNQFEGATIVGKAKTAINIILYNFMTFYL